MWKAACCVAAVSLLASSADAAPGDVLRSFGAPVAAPHHGTYPLGLATDGQRLFIANIEEASNPLSPYAIFVVSAEDGTVQDRFDYNALYQTLKDMTFAEGELWALNADRKRRRISPDFGTNVEGYATMTIRMRGMAWDAGCGAMWEIVEETGQLGELDTLFDVQPSKAIELRSTSDGAVLHTTSTVSDHTYWYSLAYDGCSLWSVDRENLELVRIDPFDGEEIERLPTPSDRPIGLTYREGELLVSDNGTDRIYAIEIGPTVDCTPTPEPTTCSVPGLGPPPEAEVPEVPVEEEPPVEEEEPRSRDESHVDASAGCSAGGGESGGVAWFVLLLGLLFTRSRCSTSGASGPCRRTRSD